MAMNDARINQQCTDLSIRPNNNIDNGVIVDITRLSVTPAAENQSDIVETNCSSANTSSSNDNIDSGVVLEIQIPSVNASV